MDENEDEKEEKGEDVGGVCCSDKCTMPANPPEGGNKCAGCEEPMHLACEYCDCPPSSIVLGHSVGCSKRCHKLIVAAAKKKKKEIQKANIAAAAAKKKSEEATLELKKATEAAAKAKADAAVSLTHSLDSICRLVMLLF